MIVVLGRVGKARVHGQIAHARQRLLRQGIGGRNPGSAVYEEVIPAVAPENAVANRHPGIDLHIQPVATHRGAVVARHRRMVQADLGADLVVAIHIDAYAAGRAPVRAEIAVDQLVIQQGLRAVVDKDAAAHRRRIVAGDAVEGEGGPAARAEDNYPAAPAIAQGPANLIAPDQIVGNRNLRRGDVNAAAVIADAHIPLHNIALYQRRPPIDADAPAPPGGVVADQIVQNADLGVVGKDAAAHRLAGQGSTGGAGVVVLDQIVGDDRRATADIDAAAHNAIFRNQTADAVGDAEAIQPGCARVEQRDGRVAAIALQMGDIHRAVPPAEVAAAAVGIGLGCAAHKAAIEQQRLVLHPHVLGVKPTGHSDNLAAAGRVDGLL